MSREKFLARARALAEATAQKERRKADLEAAERAGAGRTADALVAALAHLDGLRLKNGVRVSVERNDSYSEYVFVTVAAEAWGNMMFRCHKGEAIIYDQTGDCITLAQAVDMAEHRLAPAVDTTQDEPEQGCGYEAVVETAGSLQMRLYDTIGDMGPSEVAALAKHVFGPKDPDVRRITDYFTRDKPRADKDEAPPF
jgi:hypothetical protein